MNTSELFDSLSRTVLRITSVTTIVAGIPAMVLFGLLGRLDDGMPFVWFMRMLLAAGVALTGVVCLRLSRSRPRTAAWVMSGSMLTIMLFPPFVLGLGMHAGSLPLLVIVVLVAGLLGTPRAALILGSICTVGIALIWLLLQTGVLPSPTAAMIPNATLLGVVLGSLSLTVTLLTYNYSKLFRDALAQLERAREEADAASAAKSRFLATMSHEIRTPLNGVLGMARLLQSGALSEAERTEATRTILSSGQVLLTVLNDVLDVSRAETGRLPLTLAPALPAELLEQTRALFAESARQTGHTLSAKWEGPPGAYRVDGVRLRQMLGNFVNNALKFAPGGAVTLRGAADGERLRFEVSDEGPGVPAGRLDELFRPFVQVHDSAQVLGGSGLGLSIVRTLAEQMGGRVGVQNHSAGPGATFWFEINAPRELAPPPAPEPVMSLPVAAVSKRRVLVVEDNPVNQRLVSLLLTKLGYEVATAGDGQEALDWLAQQRPDLVLMDCQMPVLDGIAATRQQREREAAGAARVPIVALTASAFPEEKERCLSAGMDDFLLKPIDFAELRRVLDQWAR